MHRVKDQYVVKLNPIKVSIAAILLIVYSDSTIFAMRYMYSAIFIALFGCIILMYAFYKGVEKSSSKSHFIENCLMLAMLGSIFINNFDFKNRTFKYEVLTVVLVFLFLCRSSFGNYYAEVFIKFILYFGFLTSVATIFFYFSPKAFSTYVIPKIPQAYYAGILYCFQHGYQSGIALHYSANAIFIVLFLGVLFSKTITKESNKVDLVLFAIGIIALLMTAKRAHTVFSIFAMYVAYFALNKGSRGRRWFKALGFVLAVFVVYFIIESIAPDLLMVVNRITSMTNENFLGGRLEFYSIAINVIKTKPIFGNGWGSFKYLAENQLGEVNEAHNVFLQIFAETGIVGFVICFSVILMFVTSMIKVMKYTSNIYEECFDSYKCYCCYFAVFFLLYCMTGNPLYDNQMWMPLVLLASFTMKLAEAYKNFKDEKQDL